MGTGWTPQGSPIYPCTPVASATVANWQSGTGTSGETGADLVSIGTNDIKNRITSLVVSINNLTAGAIVNVRMYSQVNGTERKIYDQPFVRGTSPDGLWIVNGSLNIHEVLRVEVQSDTVADNGKSISYDYIIESM